MDSTEYMRVYKEHVNIAKKMFLKLPNKQEGMEWAEHAVHVALLTHNEQLGDLSTHVYHTAKKYKNKFVRSYKRWNGIRPSVNKSIQTKYVSTRKYTQVCQEECEHLTTPCEIEIYSTENSLDLKIDLKNIVQDLEQKHKMFKDRLSIVIEGWMSGETDAEVAIKIGCSRQWVSHLKRKFKEKLRHFYK